MERQFYSESISGFIAIIIWCIVSAIAYVFTTVAEETINANLLCFGIFLVALIFFSLTRINNLKKFQPKFKTNIRNIFIINITTFGCWFLTIYPLGFLEPSIVQAIILAVLPICTFIIGTFLYHKQNVSYFDFLVSILFFLGIFFIVVICMEQKTIVQHFTFLNLSVAILSCIGAGIFLSINNIYTKKLSDNDFSPFDILATRFLLITIITGIFSFYEIDQLYNINVMVKIIIIAFTLVIIPQIAFQYALKGLQPITISIISPIMPVLVFIAQFSNSKLHPSFYTIVGVIYISGIAIMGSLSRYKKNRKSIHLITET